MSEEKQSALLKTERGMDADLEPTGMYLRRVLSKALCFSGLTALSSICEYPLCTPRVIYTGAQI